MKVTNASRRAEPAAQACKRPAAGAAGRTLIHIPVIHTQADMGALAKAIQALTIHKLGQQGWQRNLEVIDEVWSRIEAAIEGWSLPYQRVRLYQDGLPVCGREEQIVTELAKAGSRNHQLVLRLKRRGATIMGTESAELLVLEYKLIKQALDAVDGKAAGQAEVRDRALSLALLAKRDQAIAERINQTLAPGETGIIFLGMLHRLEPWLAKDIRVRHPIFRPPAPADPPL
ncbi:MAG: hypothetical protein ABSF95_20605 [Verrucomicrobiota bacterium]|jgi:hypothetical protein